VTGLAQGPGAFPRCAGHVPRARNETDLASGFHSGWRAFRPQNRRFRSRWLRADETPAQLRLFPVRTPENWFASLRYMPKDSRFHVHRPRCLPRNIRELADMPKQLAHERLAEPHDLGVGFSLRVEVGPPFPPPMGSVVKAFLNTCSKARNFKMLRFTDGWKRKPPL